MKKLLIALTFLFTLESQAGDAGALGLDEDFENAGKVLLVVGGIAFLVAYNSSSNSFNGDNNIYFDENANTIRFSEDTGLSNLEINFSSNFEQDIFNNDLYKSDDLYLGLTYRF
jgi:hypothetical protein|tara:strand:- start:641 stop:982 length:342 start_codon:yes stop_codon:yes gene_type:complete